MRNQYNFIQIIYYHKSNIGKIVKILKKDKFVYILLLFFKYLCNQETKILTL